jgi:hypothetical protein
MQAADRLLNYNPARLMPGEPQSQRPAIGGGGDADRPERWLAEATRYYVSSRRVT